MPTKKRRIGFIPRTEVLDLINKLSYENNLSNSKIINILVEEALSKRGIFNKNKVEIRKINTTRTEKNKNQDKIENLTKEISYEFDDLFKKEENLSYQGSKDEALNLEIYEKFLMFLQFEERMKDRKL